MVACSPEVALQSKSYILNCFLSWILDSVIAQLNVVLGTFLRHDKKKKMVFIFCCFLFYFIARFWCRRAGGSETAGCQDTGANSGRPDPEIGGKDVWRSRRKIWKFKRLRFLLFANNGLSYWTERLFTTSAQSSKVWHFLSFFLVICFISYARSFPSFLSEYLFPPSPPISFHLFLFWLTSIFFFKKQFFKLYFWLLTEKRLYNILHLVASSGLCHHFVSIMNQTMTLRLSRSWPDLRRSFCLVLLSLLLKVVPVA